MPLPEPVPFYLGGDAFMALTTAQQLQLVTDAHTSATQIAALTTQVAALTATVATLLKVEKDNQTQLRGPGLTGWPQLGSDPGGYRTLVSAFGAFLKAQGLAPGF